jgi:cytochrome c biogenesis protein CcmG, thiol:disulfide interchange protein DsbE
MSAFRRFASLIGAVAFLVLATTRPAQSESESHTGLALRAIDGARVNLDERLDAGPVLLDFWATWCRPCERSLPSTQKLYEELREQGFTVIGVSVDGPRNWARVRPFAARLGLSFPVVIDEDGSLQRRFHVSAVPTTVLLGSSGRVARIHAGWVPGEDDSLAAAVAALLRTPETPSAP